MYNVSDFNSVLEVGFAVNAVLVFFELESYLEKRFNKTKDLGYELLSVLIQNKEDLRFARNYGWRSLIFGYAIWIGRLKWISILNSILCLLLLIWAGFCPELKIGIFLSIFFLSIVFVPVIAITLIIIYGLPRYKIKCIEEALKKIVERKKENISKEELDLLKAKYAALPGFIKIVNFSFLILLKPKQGMKILNKFTDIYSREYKKGSANKSLELKDAP